MNLVISTFILIIAAAISIFLAQVFPKISISYISIIVGGIIYLTPNLGDRIQDFNSNIFIGTVVAPLLFFEGQATPLNLVGKEMKHIIQTTIFLVIFCLVIVGFGVWWICGISLPLAFILSSISTPTDATAMESVTTGLKTPPKEGLYLKLESLFNDASGLILLNMATLWYVNGYINYGETIINFLISAVGGVLFGFFAAWAVVLFRQFMIRTSYNSLNAQNLLYVVTPIILYYASGMIKVSGIIAVVVAGLVHNAEAQRSRLINAPQVHLGFDLVSMITEILNSMVFVVLGYIFVQISTTEKITLNSVNWLMIGVILYVISLVIRYLYARFRLGFNNKSGWIFALGGVRGAVTLALAYTLARFSMKPGEFTLVLISESTLIILSLIVPTIVFRFILDKDVRDKAIDEKITEIRVDMVRQGIAAVEKMYLPDNVKESVIFDLRAQKQRTRTRDFIKAWIEVVRHPEFTGPEKELELRAFMNALAQERTYLDMISQKEAQYQDYILDLYNEILMAESLIIRVNRL